MSIYSITVTTCYHVNVPEGAALAPEKEIDWAEFSDSSPSTFPAGGWRTAEKEPSKGEGSWYLDIQDGRCYLYQKGKWHSLSVNFVHEQQPPFKTDIVEDEEADEEDEEDEEPDCDDCAQLLAAALKKGEMAEYCEACIERTEKRAILAEKWRS